MSDVRLLPRLPAVNGRRLLANPGVSAGVDPEMLRSAAEPFVSWAASGGHRATRGELDSLRDQICSVAAECGWPASSGQAARARFDARLGAALVESIRLPVAEALRDDVWSWVAIALVPDVSLWRFDAAAPERFLGGRRNTLQRLWLRARVFDRGVEADDRWGLLELLTEDAMVQITERPSIGADPRVATAIAEAWVRTALEVASGAMEDLTRHAVRNIRIANEVLCFAALDDEGLEAAVGEHFVRAVQMIPHKISSNLVGSEL
jgi:hypothetical protein